MKFGKILLSIVFALAAIAAVSDGAFALNVSYNFTNSTGGAVTGVNVTVYPCLDEFCSTLNATALYINTSTAGSSVVVPYPVTPQTSFGYAEYFFATNYSPMQFVKKFAGNSSSPFDAGSIVFPKTANCRSAINGLFVNNTVPNPGDAVLITANVSSAFLSSGSPPYNITINQPNYTDFYSSLTRVNLTVYDAAGAAINSTINDTKIFMGNATNLSWIFNVPASPSFGYIIFANSTVPDGSCTSTQQHGSIADIVVNTTANDAPALLIIPSKAIVWVNEPFNITLFARATPGEVDIANVSLAGVYVACGGVSTCNVTYTNNITTPGAYVYLANVTDGPNTTTAGITIIVRALPNRTWDFKVKDGSDFQIIAGANVTLTGAANVSLLTNGSGVAHFTSLTNGTYRATISSLGYAPEVFNWTLGEVDQAHTVLVNQETTPPVVTLITPANSTWTNTTTPTFFFNATDNVDTSLVCDLYADGAPSGQNLAVANATTVNITSNTSLSQGNHTWSVRCRDDAQNVGNSVNFTVGVDNVAPAITIALPPSGWQRSFINISANTSDATSNITSNSTGATAFYYWFQNVSGGANYSVTNLAGGACPYASAATGFNCSTIFNTSTLLDGNYTLWTNTTDVAGNVGRASRALGIDNLGPAITINLPPASWLRSVINISANLSDAQSNVTSNATGATSVYYWLQNISGGLNYSVTNLAAGLCPYVSAVTGFNCSTTFNTSTLLEGNYTLWINSTDNSGNLGIGARTLVGFDNTPPTSNSPIDASYSAGIGATIGWILQDNQAPGLYQAQRNGSAVGAWAAWANNTNLAFAVNTSTAGLWNYTIYFNDSAGNNGTADTVLITITPDVTPPVITIFSPVNTTYVNNTITLLVAANELVSTWNYSINGTANITFTPNTTFVAGNGSNNITIYANDSAGNLGTATRFFFVNTSIADATAPTINNVTLNSTAFPLGGLIFVTVNASDNVGVTNVSADAAEPGLVILLNTPGTPIWNGTVTASSAVGYFNVTIIAYDSVGNNVSLNKSYFAYSTADVTPPALVVNLSATAGNGYVNLSWANNTETDLAVYRIYYNTSNFSSVAGMTAVANVTNGTITYNATGLTNGLTYYFAVVPLDFAGNQNNTVVTVNATPTAPVVPGPGGGGGSSGGGGSFGPTPVITPSGFTAMTVPADINAGDRLQLTGCAGPSNSNVTAQLYVDGKLVSLVKTNGGGCFTFDGGLLKIGEHEIEIRVGDLVFKQKVAIRGLIKNIFVTTPFITAGIKATVLIELRVDWPADVDVTLLIDDANLGTRTFHVISTESVPFDFSPIAAGEHTLKVKARMFGYSEERSIKIKVAELKAPEAPTGLVTGLAEALKNPIVLGAIIVTTVGIIFAILKFVVFAAAAA